MLRYLQSIVTASIALFMAGSSMRLQADPPIACMLTVQVVNQSRQVYGPVNTECPCFLCPHSAPFGNWGVASPYGAKYDGHQFDGWCHNSTICPNGSTCATDCQDGWYEWNSCTTDSASFTAPNCTLYNASSCTQQATTQGENQYGGMIIVRRDGGCPYDTNSDGQCDQGGCSVVSSITVTAGYMTLYELDPLDTDDLVQTVYYPGNLTIYLSCAAGYCSPAQSSWVTPSSYDSPTSPALVYAQISAKMVSGMYNDNGTCTGCSF